MKKDEFPSPPECDPGNIYSYTCNTCLNDKCKDKKRQELFITNNTPQGVLDGTETCTEGLCSRKATKRVRCPVCKLYKNVCEDHKDEIAATQMCWSCSKGI